MPAYARRDIVAEGEVGMYHCMARCVRQAFLCGRDAASGKDFEHRRGWIQRRLEKLAAIFAVDVCGFSVMGNHLHVVLRIRPDVVEGWSDEQVGRRWWRLCPGRKEKDGSACEPLEHEWKMLVADPQACEERRKRLASLSWFMRALCEPIARRANREDRCRGRFWEGRFKCQALLDGAAILACSVYVDLNPIRAGLASRPEESRYTSAYERITARQARLALRDRRRGSSDKGPGGGRNKKRISPTGPPNDAWLCGMPVDERSPAKKEACSPAAVGLRASDRGFLPLALDDYLRLLDWTGRQVRLGKRGAIPADLAPILERLQVAAASWVESVAQFGRWFHREVGQAGRMAEAASRAGKHWFQGVEHARQAFT
jgi:hypothetical protein